jgi:hypothetical protein
MLAWSIAAAWTNGDCAIRTMLPKVGVSSERLAAAPRDGMALVACRPVAPGVASTATARCDMQEISAMGSADGRITDFGLAPKWD